MRKEMSKFDKLRLKAKRCQLKTGMTFEITLQNGYPVLLVNGDVLADDGLIEIEMVLNLFL